MSQKRYAIVTGGASGLGRAICLRLAKDGWEIAIVDLNDTGSQETLQLVRNAGGSGRVEHLDVADANAWQALREKLEAQWPRLDLLVNNAGVAASGDVGEFPLESWHWVVNVNLWNGILGCHTMVPWMKKNSAGGHIINTASMAAIASAPGMGAYNVTKAGMLSLSETLYGELMPHGIGVTVLCPGFFPTNLLTHGRFTDDRHRKLAEREFARAKFNPTDVANAAIDAMARKRFFVVMPAQGRFYWRLKRLMPARFLRMIADQFARRMSDKPADEVFRN